MEVDVDGLARTLDELDDLEDDWTDDGGGMLVGTAVGYSVYLEFGTSEMDPKPFFRPVLQEAKAGLDTFVASNTGTTLEQIDSAEELVKTVAFAIERRVKQVITAKGLVDTGALRASVAAVESRAGLKTRGDVAAQADVDLDPEDFE